MPRTCLIVGCGSRYKKDLVHFYSVPAILNHRFLTNLNDLSRKRRERWLAAIKRDDLTESKVKNQRVCGKHFISGKPAALQEENHPDWVPSQNMEHTSYPFLKPKSDEISQELLKISMENKSMEELQGKITLSVMPSTCNVCLKVYPNTSNLHTHMETVHKTNLSSLGHSEKDWHYMCLEKQCKKLFESSNLLLHHLRKRHRFKFEHTQITVTNMEEFFKWKSYIEKDNDSKYVLKNTMNNKKYTLLYYKCNKCHVQSGQAIKQLGTKMQIYCNSQLKLYKEHGKESITISWIKIHYGHGIEIPTLESKRGKKRKKLQLYDDDEFSIETPKTFERNDLQNFDESIIENTRDTCNISALNKYNDSDPVLFHKIQESRRVQHFETNDFCLIIMNQYQKDMLKQFGDNIIAIDSTQNLNNHDFDLTTLAILDDNNEIFPVAYMLCNRKDLLTFTFLFKTLKNAVGVVRPKIFMSDLIDSYYDAWIKIMGHATHHVFLSWRINQAWALDLKKISNNEKRKEVYENLITLQKEPEEYNFQIMLNDILQYLLEEKETKQFGKYFKNNYCNNYQKWAFCIQQEYGIDSDINLESLHELTNYFDLVMVQERSFDTVLQTIFKCIKDAITKRNLKTFQETKPFLAYEVEYIDNYWNVQDDNEIVCQVKKISDDKCCDIICTCCNTCLHMYTCDCFDYLSKKLICIHIHCVLNNLKQNNETDNLDIDQSDVNTTTPFVLKDLKIENDIENNSELEDMKNDTSSNINELKHLIEFTFDNLQTVKLDNVENSDIEEISSHLNVINEIFFKYQVDEK